MISEEGEKVSFNKTFNPKNAGGNVEKWLIDCEYSMRSTLKHTLLESFHDYAKTERIKWVIKWPGQIVLCIASLYWTTEVAESISNATVQKYADKCTSELMKVVDLVRGKLSKLDRKTLSALIVLDVHARDVVQELASQGVSSETDFEWMS